MEIPRIDELRIYYNTHIRAELMRMERERKRMLGGIIGSLLALLALLLVFLLIEAGFVVVLLALPVLFYIGTLYFRVERFRHVFKEAVVNLVLDFMQQQPNVEQLSYDSKKMVAQDRFIRSDLFQGSRVNYKGEDYIKGIVGEMVFEMSELYVQEISLGSNRLNIVFSGVFLHGLFNEPTDGHVVVWPREQGRFQRASIREFVASGGIDASIEIQHSGFREHFAVYATRGTVVHRILTEPMQEALLDFVETTGHELYFSVYNQDVFAAIQHERDLLEPFFFKSNISFALIREFYADVVLMLSIIQRFDQNR